MSIVIKELFPSDPISEAVEKINFNFDQLLLAGGGPPGIQGIVGPVGPIGAQGPRGDHWFTGSTFNGLTADHDGVSPLQVQDNFLGPDGRIWNYFDDGLGGTGWTYSGIQIVGPTGATGDAGGSLEWDIFLGISGNLLTPSNRGWGPRTTSTTVDDGNINFIVPVGATKNSLLIGDPSWMYTKLRGWGRIPQTPPPSGPYSEGTPRLAIIQRQVDFYGINGIQIGAQGLTGATFTDSAQLVFASALPGATVNAIDFFNIGIGAFRSYAREITPANTQYWSHSASIKTFRRDIVIEAGEPASTISAEGTLPSSLPATIRMRSGSFTYHDFDSYRWINVAKKRTTGLSIPLQTNVDDHVIEINSMAEGAFANSSIMSYLHLQGASGFSPGPGPVIIGPLSTTYPSHRVQTSVNVSPPSLIIERDIQTTNNQWRSALAFNNPELSTTPRDFVAEFVPIRNSSLAVGDQKSLILRTGNFVITPYEATSTSLNINHAGRFPLHVNQNRLPVANRHLGWPDGATGWWSGLQYNDSSQYRGFAGWLAGFDQYDLTTPNSATPRGLGIGLIANRLSTIDSATAYDPIIQSYFANQTYSLADPSQSNFTLEFMSFPSGSIFAYPGGTYSNIPNGRRGAPHLYMQIGNERLNGNLGLGFGPSGPNRNAWSKLSVNGSVRIGNGQTSGTGIHDIDRANTFAQWGLMTEGRIVSGVTGGSTDISLFRTTHLSPSQILAFSPNIIAANSILTRQFIARSGSTGASAITSFALPDAKTGMSLGGTGEGLLVAAASNASADPGSTALATMRWSTKGDFPWSTPGFTAIGVQSLGVHSDSVRYLNTNDIMNLGISRAGWASGSVPGTRNLTSANISWRYILHEIPTDRSIIVLNLQSQASTAIRFTSNVYTNTTISSQAAATYLNQTSGMNFTSSSNTLSGWAGRRYTLAPGVYEGQTLTLICMEVNEQNRFVIFNSGPLPTGEVNTSVTLNQLTWPDRCMMTTSPTVDLYSNFSGYPGSGPNVWPIPVGWTANDSAANSSELLWFSEASSINGNPIYKKGGAFGMKSGRSITFKWVRTRGTGTPSSATLGSSFAGTQYSWVEISREYLFSGSGNNFNRLYIPDVPYPAPSGPPTEPQVDVGFSPGSAGDPPPGDTFFRA